MYDPGIEIHDSGITTTTDNIQYTIILHILIILAEYLIYKFIISKQIIIFF